MFKVKGTVYLTVIASLAALATLCNAYLTIPTGVNGAAISFAYIPCLIAGALLGPLAGLAVGFTGDLIGHLIHPLGPYNPIIGVASALLGFIPGFVFKEIKLKKVNKEIKLKNIKVSAADAIRIVISFLLTFIICTASLNTYAMFIMYSKGKTFWAYFAARLPWQSLMVAINLVLCVILFPLVKHAYQTVFRPKSPPPDILADDIAEPEKTEQQNENIN